MPTISVTVHNRIATAQRGSALYAATATISLISI